MYDVDDNDGDSIRNSCDVYTGPPLKSSKYKKLISARLGVSRTIYVNVDSPNLGFTYFNFLGGGDILEGYGPLCGPTSTSRPFARSGRVAHATA